MYKWLKLLFWTSWKKKVKKNIFFFIYHFFLKLFGLLIVLQLTCSLEIFFKKPPGVRTLMLWIKLRICYKEHLGCPKFDKPNISSDTLHKNKKNTRGPKMPFLNIGAPSNLHTCFKLFWKIAKFFFICLKSAWSWKGVRTLVFYGIVN